MANTSLDPAVIAETARVYAECGRNAAETARLMGISRSNVQHRIKLAEFNHEPPAVTGVEFPVFPDDDVPVEDIIAHMSRRFEKRKASFDAHTWFPIKVKDTKPIGVVWFGDPHVDDNGCNWPALSRDCDICRTTEGLYGANIGDSTNNWSDRLVKLYANQDTSASTARKLAQWLMLDSGVRWLIYLLGNHDVWGDGAAILAQMAKMHGTQKLICHDWEARFELTFPNQRKFRVFAAHDFKGHSMWNPLHGPLKASKMGSDADIYVCGDKHNWGIFSYENAERARTQTMIRVRGYKFMDEYARRLGILEQQNGCSILTIFDPKTSRITAFEDVEAGADYLTWMRARA